MFTQGICRVASRRVKRDVQTSQTPSIELLTLSPLFSQVGAVADISKEVRDGARQGFMATRNPELAGEEISA